MAPVGTYILKVKCKKSSSASQLCLLIMVGHWNCLIWRRSTVSPAYIEHIQHNNVQFIITDLDFQFID